MSLEEERAERLAQEEAINSLGAKQVAPKDQVLLLTTKIFSYRYSTNQSRIYSSLLILNVGFPLLDSS